MLTRFATCLFQALGIMIRNISIELLQKHIDPLSPDKSAVAQNIFTNSRQGNRLPNNLAEDAHKAHQRYVPSVPDAQAVAR
jgi:hypothetical protein